MALVFLRLGSACRDDCVVDVLADEHSAHNLKRFPP
jgi:hypothetical protein